MGKFFIAGVFMGAVATFAVMHYLQGKMYTEDEMRTKIDAASAKGAAEAKRKAERDCAAKLEGEVARLAAKHEKALAEKDAKTDALSGQMSGAKAELVKALAREKALSDEKTDLSRRLAVALRSGKDSGAARGLLARRAGLLQASARLWRTLGAVGASLEQATSGWSDVRSIRERAKALPGLARDYVDKAREVKKYLEENSADLGRDLGNLAPYRFGVQDEDIKKVKELIQKIQAAVEGMKSASKKVPARKDGWTDSGIYVAKGDIVQVRANGRWKMIEHWPPAGPDGWEAGSQHKITPNARAGSLIMRISISEKMSPAYLGRPIPADRDGRVVLRMNDKTVSENGGEVRADILCISPGALKRAVDEWRRVVGK